MRVVVIGSGIVGAAAAHHLSGRGVSVTVVDGAYPGQATQAGAGIVCPWVDHPDDEDWYRLTREGARHYPGLVPSLGGSLGYARVGALLVAGEPSDLEPVRALLARRYAEAPEMGDVVDVAAPSALFPPLAEDLSALLVPGAARVDGRAVRDALLRAALRQGADLRTGTATLTPDGGVLVREVREADSLGRVSEVPGAPGDRESWRQAAPGPHGQDPSSGNGPGTLSGHTGEGEANAAGSPYRQHSPYRQDSPYWAARGEPGAARGEPEAARGEPGTGRDVGGAVGSPYGAEPVVVGGEVAGGRPGAIGDLVVEADVVIVAAGAWSGEVCRGLGVELPVFPRRGQIVHVTLEGVDTSRWPIVLPHVGPYLLGFPGSRVVVGATIEDVGFAPRITMGGLDEVLRAGLRVAPGLSEATVTETRVGLRPVHAPGPPLIGPVSDRVIVATGLGAYGLTAGPFAGQMAAGLALGEEPPLDLRPYHPRLP